MVSYLRNQGYDVLSAQDLDPRAPDETILQRAVDQDRLVVAMDKDFGELVFKSGRLHRGVLLLRLEEQDRKTRVRIVSRILRKYGSELPDRFCVYQNERLRIRS